jgi:hypothetical protein
VTVWHGRTAKTGRHALSLPCLAAAFSTSYVFFNYGYQ